MTSSAGAWPSVKRKAKLRSLHVAHFENSDKKESFTLFALDDEGTAWRYSATHNAWEPLDNFEDR